MIKSTLAWLTPQRFYQRSGRLLPWLRYLMLGFFSLGLWLALVVAPADYQQGEAVRIIYVHVPAAFMSLALYAFMTVSAVFYLVFHLKLVNHLLYAAAPLGALFTFLALVTGALWGKPMWGTYWIWDARLTSEFILLLIYLSILLLKPVLSAYSESFAAQGIAIWVLVGCLDLPIIHYSVVWWQTLHQGPTLAKWAMPSMPMNMLWPLLCMLLAFSTYSLSQVLRRTRTALLIHERKTAWVQRLILEKGA